MFIFVFFIVIGGGIGIFFLIIAGLQIFEDLVKPIPGLLLPVLLKLKLLIGRLDQGL